VQQLPAHIQALTYPNMIMAPRPSAGQPMPLRRRHQGVPGRKPAVWSSHGLWLWLRPALSPYTTPPTRAGLPADQALRRLVQAARTTAAR